MRFLLLALCLCVSAVSFTLAAEPDPYAAARAAAVSHHQPLVILIGAAWCPPCRQVDRDWSATLRTRGAYVHLDLDRHRELCHRLTLGSPTVPRVIVYAPDGKGGLTAPRVYVGTDQIRVYVQGK